MQIISKFKELDIFGSSIRLNYRQSGKYVSNLGAFASIVMMSFILSFLSNRVVQFLSKEVTVVQNMVSYQMNPSLVNITSQNFMFGLKISQNNFTTRPYFNITLEQRDYYLDQNQNKVKSKRILNLIPCTKQHWEGFDGSYNFTDYLEQNDYDFLCPKLEDTMHLEGMFNSDTFSFLKIYVSQCVNSTTPRQEGLWDPVCASQSDIDANLAVEGIQSLSFVMTSILVNEQNQTQWNSYYLNDDLYFTFIPNKMTKNSNAYLRTYTMETDYSILPNEDIVKENIFTYQSGDMQETVELDRQDGQYAILYLRRSPFDLSISRRFGKFSELISSIGGFIQFVFIIFSYFLKKYNRVNLTVDLANQFYDFEPQQPKTQINNVQQQSIIQQKEDNQYSAKGDNDQQNKIPFNGSSSKKIELINMEESVRLDTALPIMANHVLKEEPSTRNNSIKNEDKQQQAQLPLNHSFRLAHLNLQQPSLHFQQRTDCTEQNTGNNTPKVGSTRIFKQEDNAQNLKSGYPSKIFNEGSNKKNQKALSNQKEEEKIKRYLMKIKNETQTEISKVSKSYLSWIFKKKNNSQQQNEGNLQNQGERDLPFSEKLKYVVLKFRQLIKQKQKLLLNSSLFICFRQNYNNWKLLRKGFQFIKNDLDICVLIGKMQELQKMKSLLLSDEQQTIFDFIPKPIVGTASNLDSANKRALMKSSIANVPSQPTLANSSIIKDVPALLHRISFTTLGSYQILFESYTKIKEQSGEDNLQVVLFKFQSFKDENHIIYVFCQQKSINQKLIQFLGTELCELFDTYDYLMKDPKSTYFQNKIHTLEQSKAVGSQAAAATTVQIQVLSDFENQIQVKQRKSIFGNIGNKKMDLQKSIKFDLEQLDEIINQDKQFSISQKDEEEEVEEESELDEHQSSVQDQQYMSLSMKDISISKLSKNDTSAFQNNINFLNNQNVIKNYYDQTIKGCFIKADSNKI